MNWLQQIMLIVRPSLPRGYHAFERSSLQPLSW
jgi:hypothetical protein